MSHNVCDLSQRQEIPDEYEQRREPSETIGRYYSRQIVETIR